MRPDKRMLAQIEMTKSIIRLLTAHVATVEAGQHPQHTVEYLADVFKFEVARINAGDLAPYVTEEVAA